MTRDESDSHMSKAFYFPRRNYKRRLQTIQHSMKNIGITPKDNMGLHTNRPWILSKEELDAFVEHGNSFMRRSSHDGKGKTSKIYLSEELSNKKCHKLYKGNYCHMIVSFETHRTVFNEKFNLSFGYPRTDTCSSCETFQEEIKGLSAQLSKCSKEE